MSTNTKKTNKVYPVNAEKAESTLMWAMTGACSREERDFAEEERIHKADVELRKCRLTEGRFGGYVYWVPGWLFAFIKGAENNNTARWAARGCSNVAQCL